MNKIIREWWNVNGLDEDVINRTNNPLELKGLISSVTPVCTGFQVRFRILVTSDSDLDGDGSDSDDSNSDESMRPVSP
ncbi:unnamed protein product [Phytophthora fragariaefolia]|uniref:Unnamed protein product n=1 Tax=Phytophthora fragariaefolia TaxID=1490495 RepID=A0A9W6XYX1_9STRA|nr:unnamed protein product [Phytophthora fragariaefolia]